MSAIPGELRDALVRKLEDAIAERDARLRELTGDAASLHRLVGELGADLDRITRMSDGVRKDLSAAASALDAERRESEARLERLRADAARQHEELRAALLVARAAHRADWERLSNELESVAATRAARERRLDAAARCAADEAARILAAVAGDEIEAMDLQGDHVALQLRVADLEAAFCSGDALAAERVAAARSAVDAARALQQRMQERKGTLEATRHSCQRDARWLEHLVNGRPVAAGLVDQEEAVTALIPLERAIFIGVIERHVRRAAAGLTRWNGAAAGVARIEGVRDRVAEEVIRARAALPDAVAHEQQRYALHWLWRDLELRFGTIRQEGDDTRGEWRHPQDRKSTYRFYLQSADGEVTVDVPWQGTVDVRAAGRLEMSEMPPCEPPAGAVWIGNLHRRWSELAERIDSPGWSPDLS